MYPIVGHLLRFRRCSVYERSAVLTQISNILRITVHRRRQEFVLGVCTVLDLSNFPGVELRRLWGWGVGGGAPSSLGKGLEEGSAPSPENFLVFDFKMLNFGVF